jgi:penicillin-binding protein 2
VVAFVDAINTQDYVHAFSLLDNASQAQLQSADSLQQAYNNAQYTATATQVRYALLGGMLSKGTQAVTLIGGTWQTTLLDTFSTTSTLTMTLEGGTWHVMWSRNLIIPGLADGVLTLKRQTPQRGAIYASDGSALAAQTPGLTVGVRQSEIKSPSEEVAMLNVLSQATGLSPAEIRAKYRDKPPGWFVPIANVDSNTMDRFGDALSSFDAVSAEPHYDRTYPQSNVAPHVVGYISPIPPEQRDAYRQRGYTGDEYIGVSGVEGFMESVLAGTPGGELQILGDDGSTTVVASKAFVPSRDITLSINPEVQLNAQKILGSRRGAIVTMVPADGSIVAMASYPTFDNAVMDQAAGQEGRRQLTNDPAKPLLNRAIQGMYPPGSTFKMVTMSAGMGEGVTSPGDVFFDPGYWDGLGAAYRKTCWLRSGHGRITLLDGLTASCDVVFYNVGKRLDDKGAALLSQYGKRFGFGAPTGIDLAGEAAGLMPDPDWKKQTTGDVWTSGDTVNLAIGQGFMLATPLQIAQMTEAIANNGTIIRPHVVTRIEERDPLPAQVISATEMGTLPVSPEGMQALHMGMVGVTTNARIGTTTFRFRDFDYYVVGQSIVPGKSLTSQQRAAATKFVVAGKSGTAQAPGAQDKPFAWFTAYAPADHPQLVVTVVLENAGEGSVLAAPLVRQMIESYFGLPVSDLPRDVQVTD